MNKSHPPSRLLGYRLYSIVSTTLNSFVYVGTSIGSNEKVIIKVIPNLLNIAESVYNEVSIQSSVSHPYVMKLKKFLENDKFFLLVMERAKLGSLSEVISNKVNFNNESIAKIFYRCLQAVRHLHCMSILHGDIKPDNIVIMNSDAINPIPSIIDFGHSTYLAEDMFCNCRRMTCFFSAPELLKLESHSFPSDIWSLGATFYFMYTQKTLVSKLGSTDEMAKYLSHLRLSYCENIWKTIPKSIQKLLSGMLDPNPSSRLTIHDCLNASFFPEYLGDEWIKAEIEQSKNIASSISEAYQHSSDYDEKDC